MNGRSALNVALLPLVLCVLAAASPAEDLPGAPLPDSPKPQTSLTQPAPPASGSAPQSTPGAGKTQAQKELDAEEHQRVLGVIPNFNVVTGGVAAPINARQKLTLALHSAVDPAQFVFAALDAGISQAQDDFPEYGQGAAGYGKRFGAAYADNFDGTLLGNAIFPILLRQDPRYYRLGHGPAKKRITYAVLTTVRCKGDNGRWQPNYSNVLGNLAAGGVSNFYYPASSRGAGLTIERGLTVTAEGAIGAVFAEFWPDIHDHLFRHQTPLRTSPAH